MSLHDKLPEEGRGFRHSAVGLRACLLGSLILLGALPFARADSINLSEPRRWVVIASRQDFSEAVQIAQNFIKEQSRVVRSQNGWYAIVIGPYVTDSMANFRSAHSGLDIPSDAYLSFGKNFVSTAWKPGETKFAVDNPDSATCMTKDRFNCQPLSCPEQIARGDMVDWDEYNPCGLPRRDKPDDAESDSAANQLANYSAKQSQHSDDSDEPDDADDQSADDTAYGNGDADDKPDPNSIVFTMTNKDSYNAQVEFFSKSRNHVWPGGNQAYNLPAGATQRFSLSCNPGEKICYGAWRMIGDTGHWGVGREGREGCGNCCATCGGGEARYALQAGGAPVYARRDGGNGAGNDDSDLFGSIVQGLALGLGAGAAMQSLTPRNTYRDTPAPPAPRAPAYRRSGISK